MATILLDIPDNILLNLLENNDNDNVKLFYEQSVSQYIIWKKSIEATKQRYEYWKETGISLGIGGSIGEKKSSS